PEGSTEEAAEAEGTGETLTLTLTDATEYKDCTVDDLEADTLVVVSYNENNEVVSISLADGKDAPAEPAAEESTEESSTEESSTEESSTEESTTEETAE
nr:hypothetical protein [Lachnospiraceae bacterium]